MKYLFLAVLFLMSGCSDPVAEVGGTEVSRETFKHYLEHKNISADNTSQVQRVLKDYARREGMAKAMMESGELDEEAVRVKVNEFRKQTIINQYFDHFLDNKVDDAAISNYYAQNAEQYQAEKAHLAHILLRVRPQMSEEERSAQLTQAREALSRIRKGDDFAAVAKAVSEDSNSAGKGGDLGWMKQGAVDEAFSKAAFELEPGKASDVVETDFGFHIIKLIEGPKVVKKPLEAVKGDIRYLLRQQAKDAEIKRLMESVDVEVAQWKE